MTGNSCNELLVNACQKATYVCFQGDIFLSGYFSPSIDDTRSCSSWLTRPVIAFNTWGGGNPTSPGVETDETVGAEGPHLFRSSQLRESSVEKTGTSSVLSASYLLRTCQLVITFGKLSKNFLPYSSITMVKGSCPLCGSSLCIKIISASGWFWSCCLRASHAAMLASIRPWDKLPIL